MKPCSCLHRPPIRRVVTPPDSSLKNGQAFKVGDYSAIAKVSERQARRDLADLEKLSLLERHGAGPSTVYRQRR